MEEELPGIQAAGSSPEYGLDVRMHGICVCICIHACAHMCVS